MTVPSPAKQILGLFAWLLVCLVAAGIGGVASAQAGTFYQALVRPAWAPPGWIFGPVWTLLYLCMAFSAWLVWRIRGFQKARVALSLFLVQLALNALWTWLFFAWHLGGLAFAEILLLLALILATIIAFWRIRPGAGLLLLPYLAWVAFASFLAYTVWKSNPHILA